MKKHTTILALTCLPFLTTAQTALPYSTDFDSEAAVEGWSYLEAGSICGPAHSNHYWKERPRTHAASGPNVMFHDYEVGYEGDELTEDWVFSPNFNLETGAKLSFKINVYSIGAIQPEDNIELYLVKGNAEGEIIETTLITSLKHLYTNDESVFTDTSDIDIPPTDGIYSYIAFKYESVNNWFTIAIDDLHIEPIEEPGGTRSIDRLSSSVSLFPNPANDHITVYYDENLLSFTTVQVRDITGKLLKTLPFTERISMDNIPNGVYILTLNTKEGGMLTKQITIID